MKFIQEVGKKRLPFHLSEYLLEQNIRNFKAHIENLDGKVENVKRNVG